MHRRVYELVRYLDGLGRSAAQSPAIDRAEGWTICWA